MYSVIEQARRKGWDVIDIREVQGDGVQAPGCVALIRNASNSHHPFVVYFFNAQDGGFSSGDYCEDMDSAVRAYNAKCERWAR